MAKLEVLGAGGDVDFVRSERMRTPKKQAAIKTPLPELRIKREVSTTSVHDRNMRMWQREIGIMGRKNDGRGWPQVFDMFHITYVGDKDFKTMLEASRPQLFGKRASLLSYMEGFADEYRIMVRERGRNVINQQNLLLAARLDTTAKASDQLLEVADIDTEFEIDNIQDNELDGMMWWNYLDLQTEPDLEGFGTGQRHLSVVFQNNEILYDEMEATKAFLRGDNLNPNFMENDFNPHMHVYTAKASLGKIGIYAPNLPTHIEFDPPAVIVNRNSQF